MGVNMQLKSLFISISFLFTCPIFSQNIFIDSNQVAIFLNGSSLWSDASHTLGISGGFSIGGILDFGYQGSFVSIEGQGYYDTDEEYNAHSFLISGILTKKKMQVSIDLAITVSNANTTTLVLGLGLAKKYRLESTVEAVLSLSTGLGFSLDDFPGKQEFALALGFDLLMGEIVYFGPGVGYSGEEIFYGLNVGIVVPFTSNKDSR
jgi:hypothetical protein